MTRALILAIGLLSVSEARSATDVYDVEFPPQAVRPVIAATCEELNLPCRPDWPSLLTLKFRPFKWAHSVFRFPKAPAHMHNVFAFVETPFVEQGEEDYTRLQRMIDQTGPSVERLWAYFWNLGFQGADFGTEYRVVRAAVHSATAAEAVALCVFPVLSGKTAAPDRCDLIAFRMKDRRFLLSSVGFDIGGTDTISTPHYSPKPESNGDLTDHGAEILNSLRDLERAFSKSISIALDQSKLFDEAIATDLKDDFSTSRTEKSEISFLVLRREDPQEKTRTPYLQTVQLKFELETGEHWSAQMPDGTDREEILLRGGKQDWAVTMKWDTRTVVGAPATDSEGTRLFTFREPDAIGTDVVAEAWSALTMAMRETCSPLSVSRPNTPASVPMGSVRVGCFGEPD